MPNPESKNITQLYFFLKTDCKIKFSLGTQKRSQEGPDVMDIYLGIRQPKGCAAQFPFEGKPVTGGLLLLYLQDPPQFPAKVLPSPHRSSQPLSTAGALRARPLPPSGRLLIGNLCSLVSHQPDRDLLNLHSGLRLSASASFFPSLMFYELPCSFTLVS